MSKKLFVYNQDNLEPAVQRRASERIPSAPVPWRASEHSTFERPSRAREKADARRVWRHSNLAVTLLLVAVTAMTTCVIALLR
jgi:hypothetical protein